MGIADGLSIVFKRYDKSKGGFTYLYTKDGETKCIEAKNPGHTLFTLDPDAEKISQNIREVVERKSLSFLHDSVLSQKLFSIESDFVERNPTLVRDYNTGQSIGPNEIKLFTNDKAGKAGRARWYVAPKSVITTGREYLDRWKVVVSSANAGGQKRNNKIAVLDNKSAFGRSRVALKTFETEEEAQNFYAYCQSDFIRFAFLLTDEALTSLAKLVPDLGDYSDSNPLIDFSADIDSQLYKLFGIDDALQEVINRAVKGE